MFKKSFLWGVFIFFISFYLGFKLAIHLRASIDLRLVPNYIETFSKYEYSKNSSIFKEGILRYLCFTKEEYNKLIAHLSYEAETKPAMKWVIEQLPSNTNVLDVGGATGVQWSKSSEIMHKKNITVSIVEVDKNAIKIGKELYKNPRLNFIHVSEVNNLSGKHFNTILLSGVYMQIPKANKVLKSYFNLFPNANAIVIHSVFTNNFTTKLINIFKQYIVGFTFLKYIKGRAMTDEAFYKEMQEVGLKIVHEKVLNIDPPGSRILNKRKVYIIKND